MMLLMGDGSRLEKVIIDNLDVYLGRNSYQAYLEETYTSWKHIYHVSNCSQSYRCPIVDIALARHHQQ
jgi:hypothetical protein